MAEETTSPEAAPEAAQVETTEAVETEAPQAEVEATTIDESSGEAVSETKYADKYDSVGALEDAYKELQSTFSKKLGAFEGAPDDGYVLPEGEMSESDRGMVDMLQSWGTENNLSNDGLNSLAKQYTEHQEQAKSAQIDAEFKKLGDNADRRLANARDFLTANLGEEGTKAIAQNMTTAASIEAIEALIGMTKGAKPAQVQATSGVSAEKLEAMRFAVNKNGERLMSVDEGYRKQVMALEAKAKGSPATYLMKD